jgi:7,8-didemethyl-8-hydroxy-5-deazariboflavin synthase CofG subunit
MRREVTYCLSYPIVLTRKCANRCGYCRFPVAGPERLPSLRVVRSHLREAARRGATQIELIAGEGISTDPEILSTVRYYGFSSYLHYLMRILQMVEATNRRSHLFSLLNIGPLSLAELGLLRPYLCALRIMLESADAALEFREAHLQSPDKAPERRLEAILCCGKAGVPLTTGILVGIGESPASRLRAFDIIARVHERYRHIQAVRLQMFHPVPGTPMEFFPRIGDEEFLEVVALARHDFGPDMAIQVSADEHPHLIGRLLGAGVNDFGDLSLRRPPGPHLSHNDLVAMLGSETQARGLRLVRRFPVLGPYCSARWYPSGFPDRIPGAREWMFAPVR